MNILNILPYLTSALPMIMSAEVGDDVRKWVLFGLGILSLVITLAIDIYRLYRTIQNARKDGKITEREQEAIDKAVDQIAEDLKPLSNADKIDDKKGE